MVYFSRNLRQAARVSDYTAFMLMGEIVEFDVTTKIFTNPKDRRTENYLMGKFG